MDPESEGKLLATTEGTRPCLALLANGERIFIFEEVSKEVQLFSISTGECLRTYRVNIKMLENIMPLSDEDAFVCGGCDCYIVVHRISDGLELDRFRHRDGWPTAFALLDSGLFLVGTSEGEILEMQLSEDGKLTQTRTFTPCPYKHIDEISVSGNRFAICSYDASLVAVFVVDSFERVGALYPELPNCIHLTETVLVAGCDSGQIFVHDAVTFDVLREMQIHSAIIRSIHVMSDARCILSCGSDGSFHVQDVTTGAPLWQTKFNTRVWASVSLPEGRLVTAFDNRVISHSIPYESREFSPLTSL